MRHVILGGGVVVRALCFILILFLPYEQRGGGGGGRDELRCQVIVFLFSSLFSTPRTGLVTLSSSFFGLVTNTLDTDIEVNAPTLVLPCAPFFIRVPFRFPVSQPDPAPNPIDSHIIILTG